MKNLFFLNVTNHEKKLPYYIHGAAFDYDQEELERPQGWQWYQLNICKKGSGTLYINGLEIVVREGDSLIIYPDIPYKYIPSEDNLIVSWIAFDGFQVSSMFKSIGINGSGVYHFNNNNEIFRAIESMMDITTLDLTEQGFQGSRFVYDFLLILMKNIKFENSITSDFSIEKLKPAIDYMNSHLAEQIGIDDIAASMNITAQHFCILFKSIMNQRPFEYLNSLRINHAKNLLINRREYPIKDISKLSGYPNQSYFCSIFKKHERLTPVKFRQLYCSSGVYIAP